MPKTRATSARVQALRLLGEQRRRDARARDLLRSSSAVDALTPDDRALATRLVLGVTATSGQLDQILSAYVRKLEPRVRDALRLATFELLHLQTPESAAVSQGVELVASVAPRARGMANAVLRKVASQDAPRVASAKANLSAGSSPEELSLASGLPVWLTARMAEQRGCDGVLDLVSSYLDPAPVWVSRNDCAKFPEAQPEDDLELIPELLPRAFRVANAGALGRSRFVRELLCVASDYASQQVARIAAPEPNGNLLEIGQGRGTKTVLLQNVAYELGGLARITALDNVPSKTGLAARRLGRDFGETLTCLTFDATKLGSFDVPLALSGAFSRVFCDVPCSGSGTMRRHPEIAWALSPEALDPARSDSLPALQLAILRAAASRVLSGGTLTYSTCSVFAEENEGVVEAFLASPEAEGFAVADIADAPGLRSLPHAAREELLAHVDERGFFQTYPAPGAPDGHFCARLVRQAEAREN